VIKMIENLSMGSSEKEFVAQDKWKHCFDALTYPILMESTEELLSMISRPVATEGEGPVSVKLA
jgi:hypothetical protein